MYAAKEIDWYFPVIGVVIGAYCYPSRHSELPAGIATSPKPLKLAATLHFRKSTLDMQTFQSQLQSLPLIDENDAWQMICIFIAGRDISKHHL